MDSDDNQIHKMKYVSSSPQDAQKWYQCPNCGKFYGSWDNNKYKRIHDTDIRDCTCGVKLRIPK